MANILSLVACGCISSPACPRGHWSHAWSHAWPSNGRSPSQRNASDETLPQSECCLCEEIGKPLSNPPTAATCSYWAYKQNTNTRHRADRPFRSPARHAMKYRRSLRGGVGWQATASPSTAPVAFSKAPVDAKLNPSTSWKQSGVANSPETCNLP